MNSKFYISYEAARLLKEKGYNEETIYYYNSAGKLYLGNGHFNYNAYAVNLSAPTKTEAIDWLESKGIGISIIFCEIDMYEYVVEFKDCYYNVVESGYKETRLEAEEAAIIGALKLL